MNYYDLMNELSMYISSSRENSQSQKRFRRPSLPVHYNRVENTWLHHPSTKTKSIRSILTGRYQRKQF